MSSLLLPLHPLPTLYSSPSPHFLRISLQQFPSPASLKPTKKLPLPRPLTVPFSAATEPSSSSQSLLLQLSIKVAQAMITSGKALAASSGEPSTDEPVNKTKVLKFRELQVAIMEQKAYIGAAISLVCGQDLVFGARSRCSKHAGEFVAVCK